MAAMQASLDAVVDWLLRASWQAAMVALMVLLVTWLLRRWLAASARYALFLLVAARLLMPMMPQSSLSVFNLVQHSQKASHAQIRDDPAPTGEWVVTKQALSQSITQLPVIESAARTNFFTWRMIFAILWLAGFLFIAARIAQANVRLSRRLRRASIIDDPHILHLLASCKTKMNIRRELPILETDAIHSPALMGLWRPRLLLPLNLRQGLTDDELRFVFLHELAHLKRHDIAIDWCLALLQTLHWFNPLIWVAFTRARAERELARDAMVLCATTPAEQASYGQTIVKLVESFAQLGPRPGTIGMLEGNGGKTQLKRRITMIADFKRPMLGGMILAGLIAAVIAVALLSDRKATAADAAKGGNQAAPADPNANRPQAAPRARPDQLAVNQPRDPEAAARDAAAQAILDHRIPEIKFNAVALGDVVEFLRDTSGGNFSVDWKSLEAAGIARTAPITTRLRDVKFSTALKAILRDAGGGNVALDFEIDDGVIRISTAEELEQHTEVQVYDARDLLAVVKDEKIREETVKELIKLIEGTIDTNTWQDNGGKFGSIRHLAGQLIVTQTKANQKQVMALLEKLREARGLQVSVQATLMHVPLGFLKDVRVDGKDLGIEFLKDFEVIKVAGDKVEKPGKKIQGTILDDDQADKLTRAAQAAPNSTTMHGPRITLFNGQQGTIAIGSETPYIAGWTAPKDGKREPQISYVKTGFIFNLQATISADRKYVTMNMQPRLAELRKLDDVPWPQAQANEKLNIQKPDLAVQEVDTIVSIPDGGTLLTILTNSEDKEKDPKGVVNILLVRPSIIIQREGEQPRVPPLEDRPAK